MDLWIRSQNKRILTNGVISIEANNFGDIVASNLNNSNVMFINVGHYGTLENAIKVLDKVQEHINNNKFLIFKDSELTPIFNEVFEMPKD